VAVGSGPSLFGGSRGASADWLQQPANAARPRAIRLRRVLRAILGRYLARPGRGDPEAREPGFLDEDEAHALLAAEPDPDLVRILLRGERALHDGTVPDLGPVDEDGVARPGDDLEHALPGRHLVVGAQRRLLGKD